MTDPHVERIRAQFTRQAETYAEMSQTRDEAGLRLLVALAGARASDRALDVACGPGFLTLAFAEACASARGVDATPAFVERARRVAAERGIENVSFVAGRRERAARGRRELRRGRVSRRVPPLPAIRRACSRR